MTCVVKISMCVIYFSVAISGFDRYWLPNTNVLNKQNWDSNNKDCKGVVFPKQPDSSMLMGSMTLNQIILPNDGVVEIDNNSSIIFDESNNECIKLKPIGAKKGLDPRNWSPLPNKAISDLMLIPCSYDKVFIPENSTFDMDFPADDILPIHSLQIGGSYGLPKYYMRPFMIFPWCEELMSLCFCREYNDGQTKEVCRIVSTYKENSKNCENPIVFPGNSCTKICGAYISLPSQGSEENITDAIRYLEESSSFVDFHLGRHHSIRGLGSTSYLYIVDKDTDDGYYSADVGKEVSRILQQDYKLENVILVTSGKPIRREITLGIFFGALFITVIFFTAIFVVYVGLPRTYGYKIQWPRGVKYNLRPFTFARFENKGEGGLSFERSFASSVVSLEKSFHNPLYGAVASTSTEYAEMDADEMSNGGEEGGEMQDFDGPPLVILEDVE